MNQAGDPDAFEGAYFPVSGLKLLVLSVCTFGIYEVYWAWNCWDYIKFRDGRHFNSFWRSVYVSSLGFNFLLFWDVSRAAGNPKRLALVHSLAFGSGYALFWIVGLLFVGGLFWWIVFLGFVVLLPVQRQINQVNERSAPAHDPNRRFSVWNMLAVGIGGLFLVLSLIGTLVGPQ